MLLLLRFAMGSTGNWKDQPALQPAPSADRLLLAPLKTATQLPLQVRRPTMKLR